MYNNANGWRFPNLSEKNLKKIHESSMRLLREVGIRFHGPEAISIFKNHRIKTDGDVVFIGESDIEKALDTTPSQFKLLARNPLKSVNIGGRDLVITPGYGASKMIDDNGSQRPGTISDYQKFCKLVQTSKQIDVNGSIMIQPDDLPPETSHLDMMLANILLCDKPFTGSTISRRSIIDSLEMIGLLWGGKEQLLDKVVTIGSVSPLSPLQYGDEAIAAITEYAGCGQGILIGPCVMAGSTGPIGLAGTLCLLNAEILAGLTLAQLIRPGVPVIYGSTSSITDLRTGRLSIGAPEFSMLQGATLQMGRFYNLPTRGSGGLTDANYTDVQAGIETTMGLTAAILGGCNFIWHGCGILSSYAAMSFSKFIVDEEICGILRNIVKGFEVNDDTIDFETIKQVGIGGEYITHPTTYDRCKTEFYFEKLLPRDDYNTWIRKNRQQVTDRAMKELEDRIAGYEVPLINNEVKMDLLKYVREAKK